MPTQGRPRSEAARRKILKAAYQMLLEKGFGGVRIETVARMAGVGKPTIYRSWQNAQQMTLAAVLEQANLEFTTDESDSPLDDLVRQLRSVIDVFSTVHGRQIAQMMAAAEQDSEIAKAFRSQIILKCREDGRQLIDKAISVGIIPKPQDKELLLDMIYGPIFYRLLNHHAPMTPEMAEQILVILGWRGVENTQGDD